MTDNNQNQDTTSKDTKPNKIMQNIMVGIIFITLIVTLFGCIYHIVFNTPNVADYVQSYKINVNSKDKKTINTREISDFLDTRITDINKTIEVAYTLRLNVLENWLVVLGLLLTFFGVLVPIFLYIKVDKLDKELEKVEKIKKSAEEKLNEIINAKKKAQSEIQEQLNDAKKKGGKETITGYINYYFQTYVFDYIGRYATAPTRVLLNMLLSFRFSWRFGSFAKLSCLNFFKPLF